MGSDFMTAEKLVLDCFALMVYFNDEPGADKVEELLNQAKSGKMTLLFSRINWGEFYYSTVRIRGEFKAKDVLNIVEQLPIEIVDVDKEQVFEAASFKARNKIAYADCFAAALAKRENCPLVTGDKEFKALESEIKVIWL